MKFTHSFLVNASLDDVVRFHRHPKSMAKITPPPIVVQVHHAPEHLSDGDTMEFTLWLGPLPLRWAARIENVTPTGFLDRQVRGPFAEWEHRHIFLPLADSRTVIIDSVSAESSRRWFLKIAGMAMWIGMPVLFAYRGWSTRRLLRTQNTRTIRC